MNQLVRSERRASKAGYHFINLYQQCPRKWWIHYGIGLVSTKTGKALIFGKAWHEATAHYLVNKDPAAATTCGLTELTSMSSQYFDPEFAVLDRERFNKMFPVWLAWADRTLVRFRVLETEVEYTAQLVSGAVMTFRPDAILEEISTGAIYIGEHKTTSYSIDGMIKTVDCQDQATVYLWGLAKARPDLAPRLAGVFLDVAYSRTYKGHVTDTISVNEAVVNRSRRDLAELELSMSGLFNELGQKYFAWKLGPRKNPSPVLFPRNGNTCSLFGCEYMDICRTTLTAGMVIGDDFEWDPLVGQDEMVLQKVMSHVEPEA